MLNNASSRKEGASLGSMPVMVAESLRRQAADCLRIAKLTRDPRMRQELLHAAALLHEEATRIEKLLADPSGGNGGGPGSTPPPSGKRERASPATGRVPPRYQLPTTQVLQASPCN